MKISKGRVHQYATCQNCDFECADYIASKAQKEAYKHAKKTGHRVTVETGTFITYNAG